MHRISHQDRFKNRVTAVFEAGAFSFDVSEGATLGQLARRLAHLGRRHGEALTAVQVTKGGKRLRDLRI
jgi:hypothetical protein